MKSPLSMAPKNFAPSEKRKASVPKPEPDLPPSGPLLDKAEALGYLKISESYLYEILAAGKLKRVQLPSPKNGGVPLKRMLFRRFDLDQFINAHVV